MHAVLKTDLERAKCLSPRAKEGFGSTINGEPLGRKQLADWLGVTERQEET